MNEFHKHKKTLEDFLQSIDFIYSGDIITSTDKKVVEKFKHSSFSASLFKKLMIEIYNYSILIVDIIIQNLYVIFFINYFN